MTQNNHTQMWQNHNSIQQSMAIRDTQIQQTYISMDIDRQRREAEMMNHIAQSQMMEQNRQLEEQKKKQQIELQKATDEINKQIEETERNTVENSKYFKTKIDELKNTHLNELDIIKTNEEQLKKTSENNQEEIKKLILSNKKLIEQNKEISDKNKEIADYLVKSSAMYKNIIMMLLMKLKNMESDSQENVDLDKLLLEYGVELPKIEMKMAK